MKLTSGLLVAGIVMLTYRVGFIVGCGRTVEAIEHRYGDEQTKDLVFDAIDCKVGIKH